MKKFLLFSFLLLIGACSSVTWGQHTGTFGNATWTVDDNGIITSCTDIDVSGALTVPNIVDGITVTGFADRLFKDNEVIVSIDLSQAANVTALSVGFCEGATKLQSITFGNSNLITTIGGDAFKNCSNLENAMLPDNVTTIGSYAFRYCGSLKQINIPASLGSINMLSFDGCPIEIVNWNANINVPNEAFKNSTSLQKVNFGNTRNIQIEDWAFYNCQYLKSAVLTDNVTSIGQGAFSNCPLTHIKVPANLQTLNTGVFTWTDVETIDWNATIDVPSGFIRDNTSLKVVNFGNTGNIQIGDWAFYNCTKLTSAVLTDNVTSIGQGAFINCHLTHIKVPANLQSTSNPSYPQNVFTWTKVETLDWNAHINVPNNAFKNESGRVIAPLIKEVNFGNTQDITIGDYAFYNCTTLTSVQFSDHITSIGSLAFNNCYLNHITIPAGLTAINLSVFSGCPINTVDWNANLNVPIDAFKNNKSLETVNFGNTESITISNWAFFGCTSLTSVTFPEYVPTFGEGVFTGAASTHRTYYIPCGKYNDYTKKFNDDGTSTHTPCNANNTIEDCSGSGNPLVINSDYPLTHTIEGNVVSIVRDKYNYPTISLNNYVLSANKLSIDWTFDARHFYYFTLPFDCEFSDITINNETIQNKYIENWAAALSDEQYNNGGWEIMRYDDSESNASTRTTQSPYQNAFGDGNTTLKAGVGYVFALLDPLNEGQGMPDFTVKATFANDDKQELSKDMTITAPSEAPQNQIDNPSENNVSNLYGNPYYWNIPISNFKYNNGEAPNAVNVIVPGESGSTYEIRPNTGQVNPKEVLFIQVKDNYGITISADPAPASSNAPARYSNQRPLRLTLSHNNTKDDHMYISSDIEASDRYVIGEDCNKMKNEGMNQIYTMIDDTIETAFNCLNLEENVHAIPVGLTIENAGEFEIALDGTTDFMPGTVLKLRDTQTGAEYNLLNGPATLTLGKGITDGRYVIDIRYIPNGEETVVENASFSAFIRDGRLVVEGIVADDFIRVYDAAGRMVTSFTANSDAESLSLNARGVYFVNVNGETIKVIY